jgi:hypothetical protein
VSALRISRPGEPVRLVDLGPAVGRIIHSRGPVYGSVAVAIGGPPAIHNVTRSPAKQAAATSRWSAVPVCGHLMPKLGEKCVRKVGHSKDDHRSARNMADIRRRRWAEM